MTAHLDAFAARCAGRAIVCGALGVVVWPLLPVAAVYTAGAVGAVALARAVRALRG